MVKNWIDVSNCFKLLIILTLYFAPFHSIYSQNAKDEKIIQITSSFSKINASDYIEIYEDKSKSLDIEEIQRKDINWSPVDSGSVNLSYSKSIYWIRFRIQNLSDKEISLFLEAKFPILRTVKFYIPQQDFQNQIDRSQPPPISDRWETFPFPFKIMGKEELIIYVSVESFMDMVLDFNIYQQDEFHRFYREKSLVNGFFYGVIGIMIFYNFFLFLALRNKVYLAYVLYSIGFLMYLFSYFGLGYKYIWGDWVWFNDRSIQIWMCLGFGIFASEFILRFLNSKDDYRLKLIRIFRLIQGLSILLLIFVCFTESNNSVRIFPYASLVLILIFIASIIKRIRDGYTPAWFLLIGFIPLLFFGFISALRSIGILPSNLITLYGTLYASALDLVILSLGLAYSIRILQKNEMKAKLANQAKSEFIAQMSHEIRTPLQGLSASIDLLAEEKDTNQIKKLREILNSNLKNLTNILNDILDFSKIEAGFFTIHKEITDINQILLDLHFFYQAKMQEKKLEWNIVHPENKLRLVFTDGTRLQQVLNNLISNAIKFTESGKVEVRYEIKSATPKDLLYFEVEDTGLGIPKKSVDKLFNNFSQAETNTSHKYGGTGLGLAICKKIINLLDGKIGVDSEYEKGSKFYFEFPIDYAEKVGINPTQKEPSPLETVHKILILEDSLELQMLIRRSLEKFGYSVQVSGTVEEAIQLIQSWNPDVILSDYHLKGQTVIDFMKLLNKELAHKMNVVPKIYVLTGENSKSLHSDCLSMGIQKVFLKPLDFKEFNRVVKIDIS